MRRVRTWFSAVLRGTCAHDGATAHTYGNNGFHHNFDTFDEASAEATSKWLEGDTLRFWDELGTSLAIQ